MGGTEATLRAVRPFLAPGGRLLLGEGFWERPPTAQALAALDARPRNSPRSRVSSDLSLECGYRLLRVSTATLGEWDEFESRYCAGRERWLVQHPDAPEAADIRAEVDRHRNSWLRGYRTVLGFAYLTLVVAAR